MDQDHDDRVRHSQWFAVTAFSIIALVGAMSRFPEDKDIQDAPKYVKWAASGISVSLIVAAASWGAHFVAKKSFVGTVVEGGLSVFTTGMWAAVLPTILDPAHRLMSVSSRSGGLRNPNLYFFSWAATITSYYLMLGFLTKYHHEWCKTHNRTVDNHCSASRWMWQGLVLTSFVVMVTSSRIWMDDCGDEMLLSEKMCDRIQYGIGMGTVSLVMVMVWTAYEMFGTHGDHKSHALMETTLVGMLMAVWTFGAAWLTFDEIKSPAMTPGNLYFFTWGSWVLLVFLSMQTLQHAMMVVCPETTEETTGTDKVIDIMREPIQEVDVATHASHEDKHAEEMHI